MDCSYKRRLPEINEVVIELMVCNQTRVHKDFNFNSSGLVFWHLVIVHQVLENSKVLIKWQALHRHVLGSLSEFGKLLAAISMDFGNPAICLFYREYFRR